MGPPAFGMSVVSTAHGRRSPRRTTHVGVPVLAMFTSEQTLDEGLQNCHFCHFRHARHDYKVQRPIRKLFHAKKIGPQMGDPGRQIPRAYRCTETATPYSAPCSLSQVAHHGTRPAFVGTTADAPLRSRLGLGSPP